MSKKEYELIELPNGIRVIHKEVNHTKIAHVGLMLDIGSRDESPEEQGLAHFIEHMVFKGTTKRSSYHIINRLESLGGELNAYTTKEKICFLCFTPGHPPGKSGGAALRYHVQFYLPGKTN